jgi:hypothetical protein
MKTQRPQNHSEELQQLFQPFENPLPVKVSFDERVDALRNMKPVKG